jgi:hypothetical protein
LKILERATRFERATPTLATPTTRNQSQQFQMFTGMFENGQVRMETEQNRTFRQVSAKPVEWQVAIAGCFMGIESAAS